MRLQVTDVNRPKTVESVTVFRTDRVILPAVQDVLEEPELRESIAPK
jgi:hypothetical protein